MAEPTVPTNLGPVPDGMTFREATRAVLQQRKYLINPNHHTGRLTLCETVREIWRLAADLPEPARSDLQLLSGAAFDYAKRMNAKLQAYAAEEREASK